jgi:type II secretory ATPase GspE/PulE/Tfp pilus assembly ATPase PilB-like protein
MAGNIIGVIAQRLVRVLCPHCKEAYVPGAEERALLGQAAESAPKLYQATGCKHCENKGYRGRVAIMELLVMDSELDELVARRATVRELRAAAMANQFRPLAQEGIQRVVDGTTSLAEMSRSVDLTGRHD